VVLLLNWPSNWGLRNPHYAIFFKSIDEQQVPLDDLDTKLREIAQRHKDLLAKLATLEGVEADSEVARLREQAREAIEQGHYDQADRLLAEAESKIEGTIEEEQSRLDKKKMVRAQLAGERGDLQLAQLRYLKATPHFHEAVKWIPEGATLVKAEYLAKLGYAYLEGGHYADAEKPLTEVLTIKEKSSRSKQEDIAAALNELARLYARQGRYSDAEPLYKRALAISEKVLGAEHPEVATTLNNLANLYRTQGRYSDAEPLYKRALAIMEKGYPNHPNTKTLKENYEQFLKKKSEANAEK
jgi:tetratricopeptide (TPR) repeat protein